MKTAETWCCTVIVLGTCLTSATLSRSLAASVMPTCSWLSWSQFTHPPVLFMLGWFITCNNWCLVIIDKVFYWIAQRTDYKSNNLYWTEDILSQPRLNPYPNPNHKPPITPNPRQNIFHKYSNHTTLKDISRTTSLKRTYLKWRKTILIWKLCHNMECPGRLALIFLRIGSSLFRLLTITKLFGSSSWLVSICL